MVLGIVIPRSGSKYGERSCSDDEVLSLMEANDNHEEEHTVGRVKLLRRFLGDGIQTDQIDRSYRSLDH